MVNDESEENKILNNNEEFINKEKSHDEKTIKMNGQLHNQQIPNKQSSNQQGFNQQGFNQQGFNQQGSNQQSPNQQSPNQQVSYQQGSNQQIPNQQIPNQQIPNQQVSYQQVSNQDRTNKNKSKNNLKVLGLGLILLIIFGIFLSFPFSSSFRVDNVTDDESIIKCTITFSPTQDMPNSRVSLAFYDDDGKLLAEKSDGPFVTNNYIKGHYYSYDVLLIKRKTGKPTYAVMEIANGYKIDRLETNL